MERSNYKPRTPVGAVNPATGEEEESFAIPQQSRSYKPRAAAPPSTPVGQSSSYKPRGGTQQAAQDDRNTITPDVWGTVAKEGDEPGLGDYGRITMQGLANTGASVAGLLEYGAEVLGADSAQSVFESWRETAQESAQYWFDGMSDAGKRDAQKKYAQMGADAAWKDLDSVLFTIIGTAPSTVLTMGPGGIAARAAYKSAMAKAAASGVAKEVAKKEAVKAAVKAGAIAGFSTEGALGAGGASVGIAEHIEGLTEKQLKEFPGYQELRDNGLSDEAIRKGLIADARRWAVPATGAATGAIGAVSTGLQAKIFTKQIRSRAGRIIQGAITEGAVEELPQSIAETAIQNLATNRPITEGIDEAALQGLVGGMGAGGGMAAFTASPAPVAPTAAAPPPDVTPEGTPPATDEAAPELATPVYESRKAADSAIKQVAMAYADGSPEAIAAVASTMEDLEKSFGTLSTDDYINSAIADAEGTRPETEAADIEGQTDEERAYVGLDTEEAAAEPAMSREEVEAEAVVTPDEERMYVPEVTETGTPNTEEMTQAATFINKALMSDKQFLTTDGRGKQGTLTSREDIADDLLQDTAVLVDGLKAQGYDTSKLEAVLTKPVLPAKRGKGYRAGSTKDVGRANIGMLKNDTRFESGLRFFAHKNATYRLARDEDGSPFKETIRGKKGKITHADISGFITRVKDEVQTLLNTGPTRGLVIPGQETVSTKVKKKAAAKKKATVSTKLKTQAKSKKAEPTVSEQEAEAEAAPDEVPFTGDTTVSKKIEDKVAKGVKETQKAAEKQGKRGQTKVTVKKRRRPVTEGPTFEQKAQDTKVTIDGEEEVGAVALRKIDKRIAALQALRTCI